MAQWSEGPPTNAAAAGDTGLILGQEGPLEEETATPSSIHAWKIPRAGEPGGLQSTGLQRVGHAWAPMQDS